MSIPRGHGGQQTASGKPIFDTPAGQKMQTSSSMLDSRRLRREPLNPGLTLNGERRYVGQVTYGTSTRPLFRRMKLLPRQM